MRVFALLLVLAACQSADTGTTPANDSPTDPADPAAIEASDPTERFIDEPTVVRADSIEAIFPADLYSEVEVEGLSAGWQEKDGRKIWEGSGQVEVKVRKLVLSGRSVTVTLVPDQAQREIMITASGDVSFGHRVRGGTEWKGKSFLMIRNDRWLER